MTDDERETNEAGVVPREYMPEYGVVLRDAPKPDVCRVPILGAKGGGRVGGGGKKLLAGVAPRDNGFSIVGVIPSSPSAPDQRNPSNRPEMRISHSCGLISIMVARRS